MLFLHPIAAPSPCFHLAPCEFLTVFTCTFVAPTSESGCNCLCFFPSSSHQLCFKILPAHVYCCGGSLDWNRARQLLDALVCCLNLFSLFLSPPSGISLSSLLSWFETGTGQEMVKHGRSQEISTRELSSEWPWATISVWGHRFADAGGCTTLVKLCDFWRFVASKH